MIRQNNYRQNDYRIILSVTLLPYLQRQGMKMTVRREASGIIAESQTKAS
jgi:hypothetical protein